MRYIIENHDTKVKVTASLTETMEVLKDSIKGHITDDDKWINFQHSKDGVSDVGITISKE